MFGDLVPQKPPSFGNVESGVSVPAPQQPFDPTGVVTGATGLFDDLVNFPSNAASGVQAYAEDYQYPADERRELSNTEAVARRGGEGVLSLPAMALSATPIGWSEKALKFAAEKAGIDLPAWVTPATSGMEAAQKAVGVDESTMRYSGARQEFWTKAIPDAIVNAIPLPHAVKAEVNARQAFRQAAAEGKPHWDATKDALDAIANTESPRLPEAAAPEIKPPVLDEFDQARAEAWGGDPFADLIPESTQRPLEGATSNSSIGASVSETSIVGEAPTAIGEATEASTVLSPAAERIRQANEESIRTTGEPLAPEVIQSLREPAVAAQDQALPFPAYHGTPHNFDQFSSQNIGTGEGSQVYGHGLYFAGKKAIAEYYRGALGKATEQTEALRPAAIDAARKADNLGFDSASAALGAVKTHSDFAKRWDLTPEEAAPLEAWRNTFGHLYEVDIKPEEHLMLDWDKRIKDQPKAIQDALANHAVLRGNLGRRFVHQNWDDLSGADAYQALSKIEGGSPAASAKLQELGIPGIRYKDATARGTEKDSHNYVVFNDKDVAITHKNDKPVEKHPATPMLSSRAGQIKSELGPQKMLDFSKEANIPLRVMREYHEGKLTTGGLLDSIVNNEGNKYGETPQIRALAGYLKGVGERLGGLEVPIQKFDPIAHKADVERYAHISPDKAAGYYESKQDVVRVHGDVPKMHVLLHETVHGLTARAIGNGRNGHLKGEAFQSYQHLNSLFDATKAHLEKTGDAKHYGLTNLDEMTAEFFSNGNFRRVLKNTKLDDMPQSTIGAVGRMAVGKIKNMYDAVVNSVRGILGLPAKAETALDALFAAQHKFLGDLKPEDRLLSSERTYSPMDAAASAKPRSEALKEAPKIVPSWRRAASRLVSWKGGDLFAKQKEEAALRGGEGDFLADRSAKLFDKAGFKKLDDTGKGVVRKAMQGDDTALAGLAPKMREAVVDTRSQIAKYQAELASQGIKQDGRDVSNMLYESLAKGNYLTRAYGIYEIKPNLVDRIGYALSGAEKQGKPYWRYRQEQKHPETVASLRSFISENLIDKTSKRPVEAQVEDILNDISDPRGKPTFEVTKEAARNSSILEHKVNVPKPIREFWGEFKDPRLESAFTISRLAALTAKQGMLNRIFKENDGKLFFDKEDAPQGFYHELPTNDDYGPLAGKYTRPDIAQSLETQLTPMKDTAAKTFKDASLGTLKFLSRTILVPAKVAKTVISPATFMVNNYANAMLSSKIVVQHAMMGKMLGVPETFKALWTNARDLVGKLSPEEASTMIRYGILRDGVQFGELKKIRSKVEKEVEYDEAGPVEKVGRAAANAASKTMSLLTDVYQLSDNTTRTQYFLAEMTIQKKLHPDWNRRQLIEFSASVARDEVPTWGRASPAVKGVSQVLGNFATWSSEVIRSYSNQVKRGANDLLNGETPAQKYYGLAQLVGTATSISAASYIAPAALAAVFGLSGTNDDKKNSAMSKLAPDFQGGDALSVADVDPKSGKIVYMDATRVDPASPITTSARRASQAWEKDEGLQKTLKNLSNAGWGWLTDQFLTPGPALSAMVGIATGENRFGKDIDTEGKQKLAVEALKPGALVTAERIQKMQKRGVNQKVINAQKAGLPMYEMDSRKQMLYSSYDLKDKAAELKTLFSKSFGREDPSTDAELKERYADYLSKERDLFRELNDKAEALKTILGPEAAKEIVADAVKEAKLPKSLANGIKNGKFEPSSFGGDGDFLDRKMQSALYNDPQREAEIKKDFANRKKQLSLLRRNYEQLLTD